MHERLKVYFKANVEVLLQHHKQHSTATRKHTPRNTPTITGTTTTSANAPVPSGSDVYDRAFSPDSAIADRLTNIQSASSDEVLIM
jgi:hypothetical protein